MPIQAKAVVDRVVHHMLNSEQRSFTNKDLRQVAGDIVYSDGKASPAAVNRVMTLLRQDHRLRVERISRQKCYFRLRGMAG